MQLAAAEPLSHSQPHPFTCNLGKNAPGLPPSFGARSPHTFFTSLKLCEIGRDVAQMFVQSGLLCFTQMSVPVRPQLAEFGGIREQEVLMGREVTQGHFYYPV